MRLHDPVPGVEPSWILLLSMADLGGNDARRHGAGAALSDFVLDRENIGQIAVIAVGPEMVASFGINQLRCDAHTVARAAHAAFEHVADTELGGNLCHIDSRSLVGERGAARD